jgi:hypothetical protein
VRVYVDADNLIGCDAGEPPLVLEYEISPYRPLPSRSLDLSSPTRP